ncbi:glucose-6-phosphate isomerase [Ammoniphilus oxalaticus]|uniref:Glucose-6-phosphate isomerase n=1 Tax=Ammoniphilus oxalaticus TaxID=66863 RepID=A0A419SKU7_9BACL|nr:cupin domain-containing protein [Ammoniphilus oxalaticus]RKD24538.1 glucose-6-phosphate isomerase [Ammoniphilus oxalaticus]
MAVSYMDFASPNARYTYDLRNNPIYQKDPRNFVNGVGIQQLNTIGNIFLLDVFLDAGNVVEPHSHPNASELLYCVSGAAVASFINPFTNELRNFPLKPGQVASFPQGWLHYATATEDRTHLLATHDTPLLQTVWFSDLLRLLPPQVFAHTYCLNEQQVKETLSPIKERVVIGPPKNCHQQPQAYLHHQRPTPPQHHPHHSYPRYGPHDPTMR